MNIRILVTGSRGKSSVVRLIHRALVSGGIEAYGRITGVIPRTLTLRGELPIYRSSGAHVREMKWWINAMPSDAEAVVMENSAVSPDLQHLASLWLDPTLTVLTNVRPDHQDAWGNDEDSASVALCKGIPGGGRVLLGAEADRPLVRALLKNKGCMITVVPELPEPRSYRVSNEALALEACRISGVVGPEVTEGIKSLLPDIADFSVLDAGGGKLAFAFSANDVVSSESLFYSLGWRREDVTVLFNHRRDRGNRLRVFAPWIEKESWKDRIVIGDRPFFRSGGARYVGLDRPEDLIALVSRAGLVFGCGNVVHGLPLDAKIILERMS
ncbi:capsule biosynthesis protein [Dethiosulfovibrio peptidovorans DSM 11002]|uniref:Capsule biosynthesis protein n=1 Tax=Dethiosulfovibrio peptidovorans DSM 11002 TaxID=469381 RepID=D2Z592_9BACT|nr:Mur ligase family protein [Dethiosulfovibrio peptidovorans]EFC90651.1 capsule biosynthesis protein [Dethiosulfovibrio peptidovorans DSM 11002]